MSQDNGGHEPQITRTRIPNGVPDENPYLPWQPHFPPPPPSAKENARPSAVGRLVAFALFLFAAALAVVFRSDISKCLGLIGEIGSSGSNGQVKGFAVLGVILVTLVAICRIVVGNQEKGGN